MAISEGVIDATQLTEPRASASGSRMRFVAVGTPVDPTPPAQIRTCRIAAYGSYLGCMASKRRLGYGCRIFPLGIHRSTNGQNRSQVSLVSLAPTPKRTVPAPEYLSPKAVQTIHIAGYRVVVEVASND